MLAHAGRASTSMRTPPPSRPRFRRRNAQSPTRGPATESRSGRLRWARRWRSRVRSRRSCSCRPRPTTSTCSSLSAYSIPRGTRSTFQGALEPRSPIAQGWLRASHRRLDPELTLEYRPYHVHREREPLTPGQIYELDVEIWPTCIVIPAVHRVSLTIRGTDHDHGAEPVQMGWFVMSGSGPFRHDDPADRPPALIDTEAAIHTGGSHPSSILLPVVPPRGQCST